MQKVAFYSIAKQQTVFFQCRANELAHFLGRPGRQQQAIGIRPAELRGEVKQVCGPIVSRVAVEVFQAEMPVDDAEMISFSR